MLALVLLIASCLAIQTAATTTPIPAVYEAGDAAPAGSPNKAEPGKSSSETSKYCDRSLCLHDLKHVACNASTDLHDKCSLDAEILEITPKVQRFLLRRFNELRDSVAKGGFNGLSPASHMGTLKWNSELAYLAAFNVRDCVLRHDECRNTNFTQNAGQTVGYRGIKGKVPELEDTLRDIIAVWMRENAGTSMVNIMKYNEPEIGTPKYNFIQIVLENAEFVGCAIVQQSRNGWLQTFFTCNYGNAPVVGSPVYESGQKAAEACKSGVNPKYVHLCAESEVYEKVTPNGGNASNAENKARTLGKRDFVMLNSKTDDADSPVLQPRSGSPVYESGQKAAEACKSGVNPKYVHLCAESEVYEKVTPNGGNASNAENKARTLGKRDFVMLNSKTDDADSPVLQPRSGTPAAEGGVAAPAADGAAAPAAAPAAEGGAAPPAEAGATPAVEGAAPGVTPVAGEGPATAPAAGGTPGSGSPGGGEAHVEGLLEPKPTPLEKAALEKKFARFLALMKRAEMFHGRRKIVVISSNHEVEDDRVQQEGGQADSTNSPMESAFSSRGGIMRRSKSSHGRSRRPSSYWAPQWIAIP
ncbi:uncharacterized protein LOC122620557 isoform X1 [Drosophila teissieri]|uniref:uncharacterized protein LOC122620557 isoform X1 n=1 Tax=Drosophila teissieri TaxID=7243 RepID=UPI001CBA5B89|nr:uncharacterized protein LOC122620557 isoform X1 [Drosophila teissieri]